MTATSGPTSGPQTAARSGLPSRKKVCQNSLGTHAACARNPRRSPAPTWAGRTSNLRSERSLPSFSFRDLRQELDALVFRGVVAYMVDLQGGVLYAELPVDYLL
jgi:hypothetical protein